MKLEQKNQLEQAAALAMWYKQLRDTNNDTFIPLFEDEHRHLVLMGGGGSGKSVFAARKVLERCTSEKGHRMLVVRKVERTIRDSCFELMKKLAYQYYAKQIAYIPRGRNSSMYMKFKNGSEILFYGLDDVEKLKSISGVSGIWIEEASEISRDDFTQLDIRMRDKTEYYQQIIITFNPISMTHWLKDRFFDRKDPEGRVRTHHSTYKENRFCEPSERITLEAFKDTDPYHYDVYCLGKWGVLGKTIFDKKQISARLRVLPKPEAVGNMKYFYDGLTVRDWEFAEEPDGDLKIYQMPQAGHPYVIGCDTAGDGSDWFVGQVIDNSSGKQVATWRGQIDEGVFAREMFALGMWYNTALIGVEANFSTHPNKELERMGYPNLFLRQHEDTISNTVEMRLGFMTTKITRALIISQLKDIVRESVQLLCDETTLQELLTFVRNEKNGREEAESGAHDDCVMALAIAYYIRTQQSASVTRSNEDKAHWEPDMYEDYYAASASERLKLIAKWGDPF